MAADSGNILDHTDFFSTEVLASPLAYLAEARRSSPVVPIRTRPGQRVEYLVTTYDLVQSVLTNPGKFSSDYQAILSAGGKEEPEINAIRSRGFTEVNSVLTADDDDHRRLRGLISSAFIPARVRAMSDELERVVEERIDSFVDKGECDFVEEFASWLPSAALRSLMGLERAKDTEIQRWAAAITRRFGQMGSLEERIADERTILEAKQFMVDLVAQRRIAPGADLVSDIINARDEDQNRLSELEIYATLFILLVGATETTFSTLLFAIVHLARNPEMRVQLHNAPELIPLFIEEVLRFYTPVAGFWRVVREDLELGGVPLAKGSVLMVRVDSANRDAQQFENPDVFDIFRKNNVRHLSFSGGAHACIGFRLAKQELRIAIEALVNRLDDLHLDDAKSDLGVLPSTHSRCFRSVHLRFSDALADGKNRSTGDLQ